MKKICIICDTEIINDPRVMRQIRALSQYQLTVVGKGALDIPNIHIESWDNCYHVASGKLEWAWYFLCHILKNFSPLEKRFSITHSPALRDSFDLVLVNEVTSLPLAFLINKRAPVYCDMHEYYFDFAPWNIRERLTIKYYRHLCEKFLPQCDAISTVCNGIARVYKKISGKKVFIVHNAPPSQKLLPSPVLPSKIRLIHHGYADKRRCIERMIKMMDYVDSRFTLDLMLTTDSEYRRFLKAEASKRSNIIWREPVKMPEICKTINNYDMGLYILPPQTVNSRFALPNKLFEFIQARLGIAIAPSPEMASIVQKYELGIIAEDFTPQSMAASLTAITVQDIARFKANAHAVADSLSAEKGSQKIQETAKQLMGLSS